MFLDAFCSFLGILMFFHNVLLYVSRLTFNFFDLEVRARAEPFGVLFCNRFVSGSKFLREKRRAAVFVAPLLSSAAFLFSPRGCHTPLPFTAPCMEFTPTESFGPFVACLVST
jgi:hypothetical protein